MAFNSMQFALFLGALLGLYWSIPRRFRPTLLLVASYVFYAYADWRFCGLLALLTMIGFVAGLLLGRYDDEPTRRTIMVTAIVGSLVVLAQFKYFDFFVESFAALGRQLGWTAPEWSLAVALPVGLSFYVFQVIGYVVDVYRREEEPNRSPLVFALFVGYFPKMLAGPIERSRHLVPQLRELPTKLVAGQALEGIELIIIGLFKKVAVADVMLRVAVDVYAPIDLEAPNGWVTLLLSLPAFGVQIYCDFSGYSDMARGVSKLFGIELNRNFLRPKNSRTVLEFWQRWHVTFTRFIRDYVLRPLGGFRGSDGMVFRNAVIVFTLTGLWHGARWPLVLWGLLLGISVGIALIHAERRRQRRLAASPRGPRPEGEVGPGERPANVATAVRPVVAPRRTGSWTDARKRAQVLGLLLLSVPLFVAPTLEIAWDLYAGIFTLRPGPVELQHVIAVVYGTLMVVLIDRHQQVFEADEDRRRRSRRHGLEGAEDVTLLASWSWQVRTALMVLAIVVFSANIQAAEFYYFQF